MKLTGALLRSGVKSLYRYWPPRVGDRLLKTPQCATVLLEEQGPPRQGPIRFLGREYTTYCSKCLTGILSVR